jgi:hypothetical protein
METRLYIYFTLQNKSVDLNIKIHNPNCTTFNKCSCENLEKTKTIKYLGIHIDENLKWNIHIEKLCNHLKKMCYYFYYIKKFLDIKTCLNVYYALVHSYLNYGILIWGSTYSIYINKIKKLQKNILKIVFGNNYKNMKSKILNISQINVMKILTYQKKHNVNENLNTRYNMRNRSVRTDIPKREKYRQYYEYIYSKILPHLPTEIYNIENRKNYKKEIKKWILEVEDMGKYVNEYKK